MYTFDYDEHNNTIIINTIHGTAARNRQNILQNGIIAPAYNNVLTQIIANSEELQDRLPEIAAYLDRMPLSAVERARAPHISVCAWICNEAGMQAISEEIPRITRFGGEIYTVTRLAIDAYCQEQNIAKLNVPNYDGDSTYAFCIRSCVQIEAQVEMPPSTIHNIILTYANLARDGLARSANSIIEVVYSANIPVNMIGLHGTVSQIQKEYKGLVSPALQRVFPQEEIAI